MKSMKKPTTDLFANKNVLGTRLNIITGEPDAKSNFIAISVAYSVKPFSHLLADL